jgi:uncharacterized protein
MITRYLENELRNKLSEFPAVALMGPRQVGKTTLARQLGAGAEYLDLENPADLQKLEDARGYLASRRGRLIILDEIQRVPELFQVLRGLIDERVLEGEPAGHFLLLGSASIDLLRQSSETLAGRIAYLELFPLQVLETGVEQQEALWTRGGFPRSVLSSSEGKSVDWRESFISTYLERDIPQLGPRIPAETLRRFWTMLAHSQGGLLNASQLAKNLSLDGKTIAKYLDLMVDLLLVRRLPPFHANVKKRLVKAPKVYVRDSGLLHTLLRIDTLDQLLSHPIVGMSWEGFVIETLLCYAPKRCQPSFYRTATGVEVDLILDLPGGQTWVIEIKRGVAPGLERGFHTALEDLQPNKTFVLYSGQDRYPKGNGIEVISVTEMAKELAKLNTDHSDWA